MIAEISHDLRTPLTRLQLRLEAVDDAQEKQRMLTDVHAMSRMIESVIAFARETPTADPGDYSWTSVPWSRVSVTMPADARSVGHLLRTRRCRHLLLAR